MSITLAIIIITILLSLYAWNNSKIYYLFLFIPHKVYHQKEYWRFVTSGFIHADGQHLIFNMISLYFFGSSVESAFNFIFEDQLVAQFLYISLYVLGLIFSDIITFIKQRENIRYSSLGASGAISSVIYSSILFFPLEKIYFFIIPIGIPGFIYGVLYLIYCHYQAKMSKDHIDHYAHYYGALFGVIFTTAISPSTIFIFFEQIMTWTIF